MIYFLQFLNTADCRTPYIFLDLYFIFSESVHYYTFHSFMSTYLKIVYFYTQVKTPVNVSYRGVPRVHGSARHRSVTKTKSIRGHTTVRRRRLELRVRNQ